VTMHESAISDFQSRHLLEPMGAGLRGVGIEPSMFTAASIKGVTRNGEIYGMPFDTWAPLWHINLNYFRKAGLVKDGQPILPHSPEELLAQGRQFAQPAGAPRDVPLFKTLCDQDLTTKAQDYASATISFPNGAGGVYLVGTWVI